jgi:hypothetical protein
MADEREMYPPVTLAKQPQKHYSEKEKMQIQIAEEKRQKQLREMEEEDQKGLRAVIESKVKKGKSIKSVATAGGPKTDYE